MSELLVNTIKKADGTGSLTVPAESGTVVTTASPSLGRRNLIINGAMQVAQRGDQTSISTSTYGSTDRFKFGYEGSSSVWTLDNSNTVAPEGFSNSSKLLCTTADASQDAASQVAFEQRIEAQNLQHLKYGTSNAQSLTLSFWVRSNKTGTYAVTLYSQDSGRIIGSTYAISAANTWEYKTITFVGDTGGTINNDNGRGLDLKFIVSAGSAYSATDNTSWGAFSDGKLGYGQTVDLADTLNNDWYITGVQLEVGSVATPFEHRSYGEELALCQRYCFYGGDEEGYAGGDTNPGRFFCSAYASGGMVQIAYPVTMRTKPDLSYTIIGSAGVDTDYSNTHRTQLYDNNDLGWRVYDFLAEAEL